MSDQLNLPTPGSAATRVAALFRHGHVPSQGEETQARMVLAASRIDQEIRATLAACPVGLSPVYVAHLVGLLLISNGTDEFSVERCTRSIREALYVTPSLTVADRAAIAQLVLATPGE